MYRKYVDEHLDRMMATQTAEGVVPLEDDDVASTAVFACTIMMQKDRIFYPRAPKPSTRPRESHSGNVIRARKRS